MTLDSSVSPSTANETKCFLSHENKDFTDGRHVPEPEAKTGSEVEKYSDANSSTWCYLFVHHRKVKAFEEQLKKDRRTYFIHTTIKYAPKRGEGNGVRKTTVQTVSGLIFLKGKAKMLQTYLDDRFPLQRLCRNCSTGEVAEIPDSQMQPFMRVVKADPERIRFLLHPFIYYSKNRTLLRIVSGDYAGLEGYVIRMARDRKLVMDVGGMSVAIGGVHAERFVEVGKNEATKQERTTFYKRTLHERNAFIDHFFHKVTTLAEVTAQAESIDLLRTQTLSDLHEGRIPPKEAFEIYYFIIEEIGYYYAPFVYRFGREMTPIFTAGAKVMQEIECHISSSSPNEPLRQQWETEYEELRASYAYLFEK